MVEHRFGWRPSLPDFRDHPFLVQAPIQLPASVDLRPLMPPVGNQGNLGSCTAWASTAAYRYEMKKQGIPDFELSELAQYYWTRQLEGKQYISQDSGATIRDAVKTLAKVGGAPAADWPYDPQKFDIAPSAFVRTEAKQHLALEYQGVLPALGSMKSALATGYPIVIGISVYESFESPATAKTGVVVMPGRKEPLLGGHALLVVGYLDIVESFIVRNSWGPEFGDHGYVYIPYAYLTNAHLASDFWVIKKVE